CPRVLRVGKGIAYPQGRLSSDHAAADRGRGDRCLMDPQGEEDVEVARSDEEARQRCRACRGVRPGRGGSHAARGPVRRGAQGDGGEGLHGDQEAHRPGRRAVRDQPHDQGIRRVAVEACGYLRMSRPVAIALLLLVFAWARVLPAQSPGVGAPRADASALEEEVGEIERLAVTAHWRESDAKIEALAPVRSALTQQQRNRIDYVHLRNRALAGDQGTALEGLTELLERDLPVAFRMRVYTTATGVAANIEDWPQAFAWLNEGLSYLHDSPEGSIQLLGVASYLHTLVGETDRARELALQALRLVEAGDDDPRALCVALSDVALAEDHANHFREAEDWRHRQIE